jgi:predicted HNH restriction endonuclease
MKPTLTLLVAMLVAGGAQASDVYKTTDPKGQPVYTDRPATLPAQRVDVRTQSTDEVEVQQRYDEQMKSYAEADKARAAKATDAADATKAADLSATAKARRCEEARQRYESYMNARRLYEPGADESERRYLSDAEIDAAREKAMKVMNEFCGET